MTQAHGSGERRALPPPEKEPSLLWLVLGACAFSAALLVGLVEAASHGLLPARVMATVEGAEGIPATTDPTTTASGAVPVSGVVCAFVNEGEGAVCQFQFLDTRGHLVWPSLPVPVPRAWLAAQPHPTARNDPALIAALVRSPYAPANNSELDGLPMSVDPSLAAVLAPAGVAPGALLDWLYTNVPTEHRPPWAGGPMPSAS
jgi:hypothetical protein